MKMAYKYNDEQPMTRMTCRDEYGNADIIGLEDVMHEFMLSLDYSDMVHLTEALNRFADLEESKTEKVELILEQQWIPCSERLPKGEVLCCDIHKNLMIGYVFVSESSNTGYNAESEHEYMYDCVAWMSLPSPFTEEQP